MIWKRHNTQKASVCCGKTLVPPSHVVAQVMPKTENNAIDTYLDETIGVPILSGSQTHVDKKKTPTPNKLSKTAAITDCPIA